MHRSRPALRRWAGLIVKAILCSSLISLLFWVRDHLLAWQKGLLRW
jgi:NitT/TauT family transport system permease protein